MQFHEETIQPDASRWTSDDRWPGHMFKGKGLFEDFVVMAQASGYFRLYFATDEGFEHVGDHFHFAEVEEAVLHLLSEVAPLPGSTHANAQ